VIFQDNSPVLRGCIQTDVVFLTMALAPASRAYCNCGFAGMSGPELLSES
jgi:hypothetical protein